MSLTIYFRPNDRKAPFTSNFTIDHALQISIEQTATQSELIEAFALLEFCVLPHFPAALQHGLFLLESTGISQGLAFARYAESEAFTCIAL
jgi:hypothetical protein